MEVIDRVNGDPVEDEYFREGKATAEQLEAPGSGLPFAAATLDFTNPPNGSVL